MEEKTFERVFNALSDANRLKILSIINSGNEVCGCDILKELNITQPTLAYHMKILQEVSLVTCYKKGIWCVYKIEAEELAKVTKYLNKFLAFKVSE